MGKRGPIRKDGPTSNAEEDVWIFPKLLPSAPPNLNENWYCAPGYDKSRYEGAMKLIFGEAAPMQYPSGGMI